MSAVPLENLWVEHMQATLPAECRGSEFGGIDLVMLDSVVAGCVSTFLARNGSLDPGRVAILGICYRDLCHVLPCLGSDAAAYCRRLEAMAKFILEAVVAAESNRK
jgi:hypothetical protein